MHFTSTETAGDFGLVERTIWQGFEGERALQKSLFFIHFSLPSTRLGNSPL